MKCSGATLAVSDTLYRQRYHSLEGYTVSNPGQRPGIVGGKEKLAWRAVRPRRWRREPHLLALSPMQQKYFSLEGYTVSKSACHNGQSAALLSDSGLVMYFSTLPASSSSASYILTILTRLNPRQRPGIADGESEIAWRAIRPRRCKQVYIFCRFESIIYTPLNRFIHK